jgi:predicted esterase
MCIALALSAGFGAGPADAAQLAPFKDRLFAYPRILEERDGGAYRSVDYRELRDINRRDTVPERKVHSRYVDLGVARHTLDDLVLDTPDGPVRFALVGRPDQARIITVFIHGRGGDHGLGMSDMRFGGNFNRIKNLMVRNDGLYLVPDAGDFSAAEIGRIRHLLSAYLDLAPNARLILACGSAGGAVCHTLADDKSLVARMAGIAFMGSYRDDRYATSAAARAKVPLYITHGGADSVFNVAEIEQFYTAMRDSAVPVRMVRFETGGHGVPIRMTDWREMINWMMSR